jgi:chromosome segregation ATPase
MKLKKISFAALAIALTGCMWSCGTKSGETVKTDTENPLRDSLETALANQDSLLMLINDISSDMASIKGLEKILGDPSSLQGESQSKRQQIRNDMAAIQATLQQRRERLDELEKKLKATNSNNTTLGKTIESLKSQIADQENTIGTLRENLSKANIQIADLSEKVDSLSTTVNAVTEAKDQAEEENVKLADELNMCYYAIGSKKELKQYDIIKTGFLKKTKVLPSDFDASYFHRADKRTLTTIELHSTKAKVVTDQPTDSYTIEDVDGQKILRITNTARFWDKSNYLVVQID